MPVKNPRNKPEITGEMEALTQEPGFLYSLALLLRHDLFLDPEDATEINWRDRLSFQEINLLVGLMVKHPIDISITPSQEITNTHLGKVYSLFEELHQSHQVPFFKRLERAVKEPGSDTHRGEMEDFFKSGEFMAEPIFYGGSGAYDFQYLELAEKRYENDKDWILQNRGLEIPEVVKFAKEIKKLQEHKYITTARPKDFPEICKAALDVFCFRVENIAQFGVDAANNFIKSFSLTPGQANSNFSIIGSYNMAESHPIVRLSDDYYFVPVSFSLTQSIYESPFYWMVRDKAYKNKTSQNRGRATEKISYEMLRGVFGPSNTYKNVKVYKTGSRKKLVAELDVFAFEGNKALVVQAKSKKLTELSRTGKDENLMNDFSEAVQKAYDQGIACRNSVIAKNNVFVDENGKEISLREYINDAYIICLTSDHYPAITSQTNTYLKKPTDSPHPLAMSVFDFELLCFYLKDPFEFLYYVRQRIRLNDYYFAGSEAVLLAAHLKNKLYRRPEADREALDESFAQLIDANFPAMKGYQPQGKDVQKLHHQWKNEEFEKLIRQIKKSQPAGLTDAIFFLYDMAGKGADDLMRMMEKTKQKTKADNQRHDFSIFNNNEGGVTFVSMADTPEKLEQQVITLGVARKYKTKANEWLAIGSLKGSLNVIDSIAYNMQPWQHDERLEKFTGIALKPGIPMRMSGEKICRNDKCPCGSDKKFKKCCGK